MIQVFKTILLDNFFF